MTKKYFLFAAAFLLLLYSVSAFDCSLTTNQTYCNQISSFNITEHEKDLLYSSILYDQNNLPNHSFIENYNSKIIVTQPPNNTQIYNSVQIKNAWISFLAVFPSVYENNTLFVPHNTKALCAYNYDINIPNNYYGSYPATSQGDCKRIYQLTQNDSNLIYYLNNIYQGEGKLANINVNSDGNLKAELNINTQLKIDYYNWNRYCCSWYRNRCRQYCNRCDYANTNYESDNVKINENKDIKLYNQIPSASIVSFDNYLNTTEGTFTANNYSFFELSFNDSYLIKQKYYYDIVFDKKPYYFAYLNANNFSRTEQNNLYVDNNTFFVKNTDNCQLTVFNHFYNFTSVCNLASVHQNLTKLTIEEKDVNLSLLFYIAAFLFILYLIYRLLKSQFKKIVIPILLLLIFTPVVFAAGEQQDCGITNLAECIPEKIYDYFLVVLNAPLLPLLAAIQGLITANIATDIFYHVWGIIRYILSFFYILLFLYAGYIFLTENANPMKRMHAKEILKDTIIMIVLIQGSYYIYNLILNLSLILDNTILSMIDPHFFLLTADNLINTGLSFLTTGAYALTLFLTMLMMVIRYIVVCFGVVIFPVALFCYFVPPLRSYGRFMLNTLGIFIFITFIDLLIVLACSMLINIPVFENFKVMVMISCFGIVNYTFWLAIKFAIKRSDSSLKDDIGQAAKYIALLA